jgi:hypothetical protein
VGTFQADAPDAYFGIAGCHVIDSFCPLVCQRLRNPPNKNYEQPEACK